MVWCGGRTDWCRLTGSGGGGGGVLVVFCVGEKHESNINGRKS